jgi:hypothetical protein
LSRRFFRGGIVSRCVGEFGGLGVPGGDWLARLVGTLSHIRIISHTGIIPGRYRIVFLARRGMPRFTRATGVQAWFRGFGSRGRSALREMLLGSVARATVQHAVRPVLVVPTHGRSERHIDSYVTVASPNTLSHLSSYSLLLV